MNAFLYIVTVLIWGSTWFAITFQLGVVPVEMSLFYRFALSAIALIGFCLATGRSLRFSRRDHLGFVLLGLFLFSANYYFFYITQTYLTSGLVAVIFSTIIFYNIAFGAILFRAPVRPRVVLGGIMGLGGLALVFSPELKSFDLSDAGAVGLGIGLLATSLASLGNMASVWNQKKSIPVIEANAIGMAYGSVFLLLIILFRGTPFVFEQTMPYTLSLLYLSLFGSVIAFGSYLSLLGRIGADRAAYATLMFPVIALLLSAVFEGYHLAPIAMAGFALVLAGNALALSTPRKKAGTDPVPDAPTNVT